MILNKSVLAHLSVFGAMVIYGANYVIMKKITPEYVHSFGLVVYRVMGALLLFVLAGMFVREKMERKDIWMCAILALFGVAFNQMLFIKGLSITSPINAAIMMLTSPLLVIIVALILKKEKASWFKLLGIGVGFLGALMVIVYGSAFKKGFESNWHGDLMILLNALSWGIYLIYVKPLMLKYNTITVVKWVFLFGAVYTFPFGIQQAMEVNFDVFTPSVWFNFLYVIIATTFLAYLLNTYALKNLSSSVVSAYIYMQPFLAACFGLMFGMDSLSWERVVGALIVFVGVYMVSKR